MNETPAVAPSKSSPLIRSGSEEFFPPHLAYRLTELNSFPASKWGFVTFDIKQEPIDWTRVENLCSGLKAVAGKGVKVECALSPTTRTDELKDWARDYVMFSLGLPLFIGIPGALAAAFWGIPFFLSATSRVKAPHQRR